MTTPEVSVFHCVSLIKTSWKQWTHVQEVLVSPGFVLFLDHMFQSGPQARFTNNLWGVGFRSGAPPFWTIDAIPKLCSFLCFTKLEPKSFVTITFIGFGVSPWLLGKDSGGAHPSRITYWNMLHNSLEGCTTPKMDYIGVYPSGKLFLKLAREIT